AGDGRLGGGGHDTAPRGGGNAWSGRYTRRRDAARTAGTRSVRRPISPSAGEPAAGDGLRVLVDVVRLAVLVEPGRAQLAAKARLAEAAPLRLGHVDVVVVDPDRAVAKRCGDALGATRVVGPDRAGEAVRRVVAERDGLVLRREPLDGHDRSEDLLADHRHVRRAVGEDRRAEEEAGLEVRLLGRAPAGPESGPLADRLGDGALDLRPVIGRDQGSGLGRGVEAVAQPDLLRA